MKQNTAAVHVGRLIEVRAAAGYRNVADVEAIFQQIAGATRLLTAPRVVMVVDWRPCPIMAADAADCLLESLKRNNARLERCAAIAAKNSPIKLLQFLRLVRSADNPNRRLFDDEKEATAWLDEVLNAQERARLRAFLAEFTPAD